MSSDARNWRGGRPNTMRRPNNWHPQGGARADPRHAGSPPAPRPVHHHSPDSTPATPPRRPGRHAGVDAGALGYRRPRPACAHNAWRWAWGHPWRTAPPAAWPPGATPRPRPATAGWSPAGARPRPVTGRSRPAAAPARPPTAPGLPAQRGVLVLKPGDTRPPLARVG